MSKAIESFGKYLLLERLAAGGMAEVYLAKSQGASGIGKFVAIKRILPQFSDNQEFIDMFKEEAKIVMNLNHGNVVSIFDFGVEKNQFFLVMEFVEGQNLRQVLNHLKKAGKYFSLDQIVYIVKEAASGIDHAHRCIDATTGKILNITHRDMSPQNIMLSFEGEVKIVDFGIAKAETQLEHTRAGTIKGKFGYMSPEQAEGLIVDGRTDIFSLGIVLWELIAKDRLFLAQNEAATLRKIKECNIPSVSKINPKVHKDLEKIVQKMLIRDRGLRYQSMESVAKDLSRFLNTHYPEFSKQEFSKSMKSIFNEMYLENRRKLAEFAKAEAGNDVSQATKVTSPSPASPPDKTNVITTQTHTEEESQSPNILGGGDSAKVIEDKLNINVNEPIKTDLKTLKSGEMRPRKLTPTNTTGWPAQGRPAQPPRGEQRIRQGTATGISTTANANSGETPLIAKVMLFVFIVMGGFWFGVEVGFITPDHVPANVAKVLEPYMPKLRKRIPANKPLTPEDQPDKEVPLSITSSPSGAQVYIDDIPFGTTPLRSHIKVSRTFRLRLILDGYLPYELPAEKPTMSGYAKSLALMAEPPSGFISIETINKDNSLIVYINGQRIYQKSDLPIKVPSGTPVVVRVISASKKLEGTETVIVGQGQNRKVRVILNKVAEIPL